MFHLLVVVVNIHWIHYAMQTESKNLRRVKMRQICQLAGAPGVNLSQPRNSRRKTWWRKSWCSLVKWATPSRSPWIKIHCNLSRRQPQFPPNPNWKERCRRLPPNNLHLITLWIPSSSSSRCLPHKWRGLVAGDLSLWCLTSIHRITSLSSPSLSSSKILRGHSWDNHRCNSSNNNSNSHFNNPNHLLLWIRLLRLILSSSKSSSSSNSSSKIS
jgi:hypothetical protein